MLVPVTLKRVEDARLPWDPTHPVVGQCASCGLCGHAATVAQEADRTMARTARDAVRKLARTCPAGAVHAYYRDRLPPGVALLWEFRGRRLPAHLIGTALVAGCGPVAPTVGVVVRWADAAHEAAGLALAERLRKRGYTAVKVEGPRMKRGNKKGRKAKPKRSKT